VVSRRQGKELSCIFVQFALLLLVGRESILLYQAYKSKPD